jgi:hypothetical protein
MQHYTISNLLYKKEKARKSRVQHAQMHYAMSFRGFGRSIAISLGSGRKHVYEYCGIKSCDFSVCAL